MQGAWLRQGSAGVSAVIYALSYDALMFSDSLAVFVGYGISIALITAVFGALLGLPVQEKTFVGGPDSNPYPCWRRWARWAWRPISH